jgi:thiamine-monophosphate kinase
MLELKIIQELYPKNQAPTDDCYFDGMETLISTDSLSEGTHFKHKWSSPEDIAIKLIEVNISDIISSGGLPKKCLLNLGLSNLSKNENWLIPFIKSFKKHLKKRKIELIGGDTFKAKTTQLSLTIFGTSSKPIKRANGSINQKLYITGNLGGSLVGLNALKKSSNFPSKFKTAVQKHLQPSSKIDLFPNIWKKFNISAAMDITDGLVQDSLKLANASKIKLDIHLEAIPIFHIENKPIPIETAILSGEELEILFLSEDTIQYPGISLIGESKKGNGVNFIKSGKFYNPRIGFLHF